MVLCLGWGQLGSKRGDPWYGRPARYATRRTTGGSSRSVFPCRLLVQATPWLCCLRTTNKPLGGSVSLAQTLYYERLEHSGETFVDHMGGALHPESLIKVHTDFLSRNILGNTHSVNNRCYSYNHFTLEIEKLPV